MCLPLIVEWPLVHEYDRQRPPHMERTLSAEFTVMACRSSEGGGRCILSCFWTHR